ncbi:MAG: UDP-N-acetylmuramoyl-tripeptide--D-alanyl-D-alanine ligase [Deltaproteobacteria bacterium]|nr:UDP-N-acetylmuramoyl-tripeptide--D-alanyl-D-alanine ligase [Deltaproteobacteria bacterium]
MAASWGRITAGEIAGAANGALIEGSADAVISGVTTDTRNLAPGELFWSLVGERFDGHDFMLRALEQGAAGVVGKTDRVRSLSLPEGRAAIGVEDPLRALGDLASWWRREHRVAVAALTGSAGKTTTKEMAAAVLDLEGPTLRNRGNFNNLIGLPLTLLGLLGEHRYAVLEMGMNRPGEIARLTEIADPDAGLITNVARAHLEGLGDLRSVARAKAELLDRMRPGATAILNGDDALLMAEAHRFQGHTVTFGLGPENRVRAERVRALGRNGILFELVYGEERIEVRLPVPGRQNVLNALAASALAGSLGAGLETVAQGLEMFRGVPGRFTVLNLPGGGVLVDDTYNANPSSLEAALDSLADLAGGRGRIIVCLGDMLELGRETVPAHLEAGRAAAERGAAHLLVLGEQADHVIRGALDRGLPAERTHRMHNHEEMADGILDLLENGDVVLLKGSRGMRLEKVVERIVGAGRKGGRSGLDQEGSGGG